ncbi:translation elongation factor Ts [Candidatus Roizmanbacteria bacterium]|nr:translation elongation factor Ts [Candidatus Roizmanbacteria bacterium]
MAINIKLIKQLRQMSKAGVTDCKRALEEANGNLKKATELINQWGAAKADKKSDRATKVGLVEAYIHAGGSVGSLVSVACETDFVARTDEFKKLAHELAMQIAAMDPKNPDELLKQAYIRDQNVTIEQLIKQTITKVGENIRVVAFSRQSF